MVIYNILSDKAIEFSLVLKAASNATYVPLGVFPRGILVDTVTNRGKLGEHQLPVRPFSRKIKVRFSAGILYI